MAKKESIDTKGSPSKEQYPSVLGRRITRRNFLRGSTAALLGTTLGYAAYKSQLIQQALSERNDRIEREKQAKKAPLLSKNEESPAQSILSEENIRNLSIIPERIDIGTDHIQSVSPILQEKTKSARYTLIYQAGPADETGRTVLAKGRQAGSWEQEDLGFGNIGNITTGVFKEWIPVPDDPNQQRSVYALLENPITKQEYLVAVSLLSLNPNKPEETPTWFVVDDLNIGQDLIKSRPLAPDDEKAREALEKATGKTVIWASYQYSAFLGKSSNRVFPTVRDLVRDQGLKLLDLAQPKDYIVIFHNSLGERLQRDQRGVATVVNFIIRRFGGESTWQQENATK